MQEVHLADLLSFTRDGEWGNGEASEGYSPALVIRGTDFERVRAGNLNTLPLRYIRSDILTRKAVAAGDTLIETAGGTKDQPTGRTVFIPSSIIAATNLPLICASFARFLRPDPNLVVPQFLFWKLQDEYHSQRMMPYHVQHTGVARFQYTQFAENYPFSIPDLPTQRAIASTLGALDDKIELNRRINETLEAMARAIFKDWFVDFGPTRVKAEGRAPYLAADLWSLFPDRLDDDDKPEGWLLKKWGELASLEYGKRLESYQSMDGNYPVFGTNGPIGSHHTALCPDPGVIIGRKGAYRGVHFSNSPFFVIDTAFYLKPKVPCSRRWAYYSICSIDINSMDSGSAIPSTSRDEFYNIQVIEPTYSIQSRFDEVLAPIWRRQAANIAESRTLAQTRDLLLPKLMSGEIRVRDAEALLENAL
jgi:type I restriction enzyme, S subunit